MIVLLRYENQLNIPVLVRSDIATGQPVEPHHTLEMTFELGPEADGVTELILIVEPG